MGLPPYNNEKKEATIRERQEKLKAGILEQLRAYPIVEIACRRCGTGRATYYRLREEDSAFADNADAAMAESNGRIDDLAESQLIELIKEKKWPAVRYRLDHPRSKNSGIGDDKDALHVTVMKWSDDEVGGE